jgi:hypothetical protein
MPLLDFYIMVDWSGGARRRGGRSDTIWIAHGPILADVPLTDSPFSRTEAVRLIHSLLLNEIESNRRVLVCFDFAYGYPVDFAAALQTPFAGDPAAQGRIPRRLQSAPFRRCGRPRFDRTTSQAHRMPPQAPRLWYFASQGNVSPLRTKETETCR